MNLASLRPLVMLAGCLGACASMDSDERRQLGHSPGGKADGTEVADPTVITSIHTNGSRTFAITASRGVFGWGENSFGQLGDGTTVDRDAPTAVSALPDEVVELAVGHGHTLALLDDGSVVAWGLNNRGQLGDGTTSDSPTQLVSVDLPGDAVAIAAGGFHSLALLDDGSVYAWGNNDDGQAGGYRSEVPTPHRVMGFSESLRHVAAGMYSSYAVADDGTAYGWGQNLRGQVGADSTSDRIHLPREIVGANDVTTVVGCLDHALALSSSGQVLAWGSNYHSQLGTEDEGVVRAAVPVSGDLRARAIACSNWTSFAIDESDRVHAWGSNFRGQLGDGAEDDERSAPAPVAGLGSVRGIAAGWHQTYVLTGGRLYAWGENDQGQLGLGHVLETPEPAPVVDGVDSADPSQSCGPQSGYDLTIPGCSRPGCQMCVQQVGGGYMVRDASGVGTYIDGLQLRRLQELRYTHNRWGRRYW